MKILGVDPSLSNTGYGLLDVNGKKLFPLEGGVIKTKTKDSLEIRLSIIFENSFLADPQIDLPINTAAPFPTRFLISSRLFVEYPNFFIT